MGYYPFLVRIFLNFADLESKTGKYPTQVNTYKGLNTQKVFTLLEGFNVVLIDFS